MIAGSDTDASDGLFAKLGYGRQRLIDLVEPRLHIAHQALAGFARRASACRASQKSDAEACFELADGLTSADWETPSLAPPS